MFDWIRDALSSGPDTVWTAAVQDSGAVTNATIEPTDELDDFTHKLTLHFAEPVRDGNDIAAINVKDGAGGIAHTHELDAGAETAGFFLDTPLSKFDGSEYVLVTTQDAVADTVTVRLSKQPITDIDEDSQED